MVSFIKEFLKILFPKREISEIYTLILLIVSAYASLSAVNPILSLAISEIEKMFAK